MKGIVKKVSIVLGVVLIIVIGLHIALFAFINAKGKDLIVGRLKNNFGLEATIGSLSLKFPFNVEIKDFECEVLSFKKANLVLGFFNPFANKINLSKVYFDRLDLKVAKDNQRVSLGLLPKDQPKAEEVRALPPDNLSIDSFIAKAEPEEDKTKPGLQEKNFSLAIGNLYLKNSKLEVNWLINKRPVDIIFSGLSLRVKGFTYPKLSNFYLKLNTTLVSPAGPASQRASALGIQGWVDYDNKDMDIDINLDDFDYIAFGKYYPPFWRPDNLRLKEAALSFKSNLESKDNDLTIDNLLTIEKIEFIKEEGEEESSQAKTLRTIIAFLKGDKEKPTLHFKLTTNMDSPKLDLSSVRNSLIKASGIGPLTVIEGAVDKLKDAFKGLGKASEGEEAPQQ